MYCPPKKFLPAWWHLSRVLLESAVWVRPAQVGALFLHNLRLCWLFWRVSGSMYEGVGCRVMAIHWYRPLLGPWDHKKVLCSNRDVVCRWNSGNELDLESRWLVRLGVLFFAFNIYTYVMFSFIEVGESKFIRVQWKKLFTCAVHVSLLSVRSHESCLITVFCMFANQRLGEYSIKT